MTESSLIAWEANQPVRVPKTVTSATGIASYARQLRQRDQSQIAAAFQMQHFEMASTFVWSKAMAALKKQLETLGSEFIGEMLQRPDIDSHSDLSSVVTESEAISLAEALGIVGPTDAIRLRQTHELIVHFASSESPDDEDDASGMTQEEAIRCLRTCVQSILGQPQLEVAESFARFRRSLEDEPFASDSEQILTLTNSPYFYQKTTLSVLLSLLKTAEGAQLQNVVANVLAIVPALWPKLKKPERWQAGQTYAELYNDGKKLAYLALKKALTEVRGFDYVPETLRSNTFTRAANDVLKAHEGMGNFYNEPAPMKVLAGLGTSVPGPAFAAVMTATLCVKLGNGYGVSWAAQPSADEVLLRTSEERWLYYLDGCLPSDRTILFKLLDNGPASRWIALLAQVGIESDAVRDRDVKRLVEKTLARDTAGVRKVALQLYHRAVAKS